MTTASDIEKKVHARIDELEDELIKVALDLSNIDVNHLTKVDEAGNTIRIRDIRPHERIGAEYVDNWFKSNGFETKRQGAPDRFNVLATYRGTGKGRSVLFNSHLDVGTRDGLEWRRIEPDAPHLNGAWREGDTLIGQGIANCKGPMACWMTMAKAIKDVGIQLPGDILYSAVIGETGGAPIDEYESPKWDSHELGARYVVSHGGMADYAVIAEATGFTMVPAMTGNAYFKVTVHAGPSTYTPFLRRPEVSMERSVNAIVRMAKFIERFEEYANHFYETSTFAFDGGIMTPNCHIGAIRAGIPPWPGTSPELCSIYLDFRLAPFQNPLDVQRELQGLLDEADTRGKVEMYKFLPGKEAWKNKGFESLKGAIVNAHGKMFNEAPGPVPSQFVSMWRDVNPYNEIGIPAISYGFHTGYTQPGAKEVMATAADTGVKIEDMRNAAKLYASIALDLCSRSTSDPA